MNIFNVLEILVSILEHNNGEYFYRISDILKDFFFNELPEELTIPSSNVNIITKINRAMNDSNKNTLLLDLEITNKSKLLHSLIILH